MSEQRIVDVFEKQLNCRVVNSYEYNHEGFVIIRIYLHIMDLNNINEDFSEERIFDLINKNTQDVTNPLIFATHLPKKINSFFILFGKNDTICTEDQKLLAKTFFELGFINN